jgi:hypothetical protein
VGRRLASFQRIDGTRRIAGYKTSHENLPKLAFRCLEAVLVSAERGFVSGLWTRT